MGNKSKVKIALAIIVIIISLVGLGVIIYKQETANMAATTRAVIVKVTDTGMYIIGDNDFVGFCSVGFDKKGDIGYKKGQEILIHYSGYIMQTWPGQLGRAGKIKVLKEESNIEIPEYALKWCYNSRDKVSFKINSLTKTGIDFTITDNNEIPYNYSDAYSIYKRNIENELHNASLEIDQNRITPATANSTSFYDPDMSRYKPEWEEVNKTLYYAKENSGGLTINSSQNPLIIIGKYDWTNVYGELTQGEYEFRLNRIENADFIITIKFIINANGEITYSEPIYLF